ncbi:MAG: ribulokinase [Saccharofermentanales bacterium]
MGKKYTLGIDYGSLSGRALLVEADTGREAASAVCEYRHGFIEESLPATGEKLPPDWTLQDPQDYLDVLADVIPAVLREAGVEAADVIGIGVDFTGCTILPIKADGTPLSFLPEYRTNKHAYVKKWKHHAAQDEANKLNAIAAERGEAFLSRYGGKISSEWEIPKIWQVLDEAPEIYAAADRFIEAGDWIVLQLTGSYTRNSCMAGYKGMWHKRDGYPSDDFFKALDPRLEHVVDEKLGREVRSVGEKAGELTAEAARMTGLLQGTPVGIASLDAHVALPGVGIAEPGKMLMIIGTSTCHIMLGDTEVDLPGICGVVEDGVMPGFYGYESGQSCVGDHFDWFVRSCVPESYAGDARSRGIGMHKYLREKAEKLKPGESGLLALDWWNGNRSVLVDVDLTGMMLGMTLTTKPEEIYRALIEATAFGTREIIDNHEVNGVPVSEIYACGGIASKDELMMQIYADVTGREIRISDSAQTVALGSAMFGAVAAGKERGGYDSIFDAAKSMSRIKDRIYRPDAQAKAIYDKLFAEYRILHDYFGRGENDVMKRLKSIKKAQRE